MRINVYLPDEIGQRAKEAKFNLSRMLRRCVEEELLARENAERALAWQGRARRGMGAYAQNLKTSYEVG